MQGRPLYAGLVFCALLFTPIERALAVVLHAVSRRHEAAADAFAVETTGTGERLASALGRLAADALSNPTPHPLQVALRVPRTREIEASERRPGEHRGGVQ